MSPLWRDQLVAVLCPDRVALVRTRHGRRCALQLQAEQPCAGSDWKAAVAALAALLARPGQGPGDLTVLLSNHFVRYLLVPWRAEVGTPAELAALASICCDETFGGEAGGRLVTTSAERAPSARMAAGLDAGLVSGLQAAAAASPLRLVSVQPYLAAAFNRLHRLLPRRDFVFVVAEPTRSCLLVATGGRWRSVRNTGGACRPLDLAHLIEREAQLAGLAEEGMPPIFVHAPGQRPLQLPACQGVLPQDIALRGTDALADPLLVMAGTVA